MNWPHPKRCTRQGHRMTDLFMLLIYKYLLKRVLLNLGIKVSEICPIAVAPRALSVMCYWHQLTCLAFICHSGPDLEVELFLHLEDTTIQSADARRFNLNHTKSSWKHENPHKSHSNVDMLIAPSKHLESIADIPFTVLIRFQKQAFYNKMYLMYLKWIRGECENCPVVPVKLTLVFGL